MTTQIIDIDSRNLSDLWLLTNGGFDPFHGFHDFDDARSIVEKVETVDGTLWPIPILLQLDPSRAAELEIGTLATLRYGGRAVGTMRVDDRYRIPLREWARKIYKTDDPAHPGVEAFYRGGEVAIAGPVEWLEDVPAHELGLTGQPQLVCRHVFQPLHRTGDGHLTAAVEGLDTGMGGIVGLVDLPRPLAERNAIAVVDAHRADGATAVAERRQRADLQLRRPRRIELQQDRDRP